MINNIHENIKHKFKLLWYYLETRYTKLLHLFGIEKDSSVIPKGMYCYNCEEDKNSKDKICFKPCKYYRSTEKTGGIACTYIGFFGFDYVFFDSCKICNVNNEIDEKDLS
jgi:hypothetical protein